MESDREFYRRRRMDDERSRANVEWEMKKLRMATTPEGFEAAAGLSPLRPSSSAPPAKAWTDPPRIWYFDAGPSGETHPVEGRTPFLTLFPRATTTRIGWLLDVPNPVWGGQDAMLPLGIIAYRDGIEIDRSQHPVQAYAVRTRVMLSNEMGTGEPGNWAPGRTIFDYFLGNTCVVRGGFDITP